MSLRGQQNWLLFWICSAKNLSKKEVDFSSNSKVSFSVNASTRGPHLVRFHYLSMGIVRFKIIHTKYCIPKGFLLDFFLLKVAFLKIHFTYLVLVHAVVWFLKVWTFWSPIPLHIQVTLMILLEGFLVRLMIGITKNPSRRIINVIWMTKRIGL